MTVVEDTSQYTQRISPGKRSFNRVGPKLEWQWHFLHHFSFRFYKSTFFLVSFKWAEALLGENISGISSDTIRKGLLGSEPTIWHTRGSSRSANSSKTTHKVLVLLFYSTKKIEPLRVIESKRKKIERLFSFQFHQDICRNYHHNTQNKHRIKT